MSRTAGCSVQRQSVSLKTLPPIVGFPLPLWWSASARRRMSLGRISVAQARRRGRGWRGGIRSSERHARRVGAMSRGHSTVRPSAGRRWMSSSGGRSRGRSLGRDTPTIDPGPPAWKNPDRRGTAPGSRRCTATPRPVSDYRGVGASGGRRDSQPGRACAAAGDRPPCVSIYGTAHTHGSNSAMARHAATDAKIRMTSLFGGSDLKYIASRQFGVLAGCTRYNGSSRHRLYVALSTAA